jgi:hypothetical protein
LAVVKHPRGSPLSKSSTDSMLGSSSWKDCSRFLLQLPASFLSLTGPKHVRLVKVLSFQLFCEIMLNVLQASSWTDRRKSCSLQGRISVIPTRSREACANHTYAALDWLPMSQTPRYDINLDMIMLQLTALR